MRLSHLEVQNFRGFERRAFDFDPSFNLLVGINGAGKTSALEALSVAIGSWFLGITGHNARHIWTSEIRLASQVFVGEVRFEEQYPVSITADGEVMGERITWTRSRTSPSGRTTTVHANQLKHLASEVDQRVRRGDGVILPLISYYGTGRLWLEPRSRTQVKDPSALVDQRSLSRLQGYRSSIDPRLSVQDLVVWLIRQSWAEYRQRRESASFTVVKEAIIHCIEGAEDLFFDPMRGEIVLVTDRQGPQPFANLSDGQRCMLAMVGDIAQKAARLNPHLGRDVLQLTPGIVLIDELELHLHPHWQRHIVRDLRRVFPNIQFIATTHSPQIIGEMPRTGIALLDNAEWNGEIQRAPHPPQSFGMDSNWIIRNLMETTDRNPDVLTNIRSLERAIEAGEREKASRLLAKLEDTIGVSPEVVSAQVAMEFLSEAGE